MEYEFTLKLKLTTDSAETDELVERLGEADCDDAVVGIGQPACIALNFTREANQLEQRRIPRKAGAHPELPRRSHNALSYHQFLGRKRPRPVVSVCPAHMRR